MNFRYNETKNDTLIQQRGIGFNEIIDEIGKGGIMGIVEHTNKSKYPNQKIMHVLYMQKIYCVPYVQESDGIFFLKTLYPSRKATKYYLQKC